MSLEKKFKIWVIILAIASLIFRIGLVIEHSWHLQLSGDTFYYHWLGWLLAHGYGFISPFMFFHDTTAKYVAVNLNHISSYNVRVPTVFHPPVFSIFLAVGDLVGITSPGSQLILLCVIGSINVILISYLAKRIFNYNAGFVAAVLAAFYPAMWIIDLSLMAEQLTQLFITLAIFLAYRLNDNPSYKLIVIAGVFSTICALTRAELIMLVILYAVIILRSKKKNFNIRFVKKLKMLAVLFISFAIVLAPWTIRNLVTFKYPELIAADAGNELAISYCNSTYYGSEMGFAYFGCTGNVKLTKDETVFDHYETQKALNYIEAHKLRTLLILAIHEGRVFYVYKPAQQALSIQPYVDNMPMLASISEWYSSYFVNLSAIVGIFYLKRRKLFQLPLLVCVAIGLLSVMVSHGELRFLSDAEVAIVILSSIGIAGIYGSVKAKFRSTLTINSIS